MYHKVPADLVQMNFRSWDAVKLVRTSFFVGCCWLVCFGLTLAQSPEADSKLRFLSNDQIKLGMKTDSGAAIAWISAGDAAPNLVNAFDRGRLIQQSYYGAEDGSRWNKRPWRWNPVQGGDWRGNSSQLLELKVEAQSAYAKTMPKHWAGGQDITTATMEQWIELNGPVAKIKYRFQHRGDQDQPAHHQELPAVFVMAGLHDLVIYEGAHPFTGGELTRWKPGWPNEYRRMTEHWAAYVDDRDEGIGVYVPVADELTCYRYGKSEAAKDACSYFAPIKTLAITRDFTCEYEVYITLGKLTDIRQRFVQLARQPAAKQQTVKEPTK